MNSRIILVLHSHIPYVKRQGRWPFGEVWLFEAMAETYIPLLRSFLRLHEEGVKAHVTISLSPTLMEQLNSKYIKKEFIDYLKACEKRAAEDERYFISCGEKKLAETATSYCRFYKDVRRDFTVDFGNDILGIIKNMQENGCIEVLATAFTHAYLPLLDYKSAKAQVFYGKKIYEKFFNTEPRGFWLPECGYRKGLEDILIENDFNYFFVDSHAIEGGKPLEVFSGEVLEDNPEIETFAITGLSTYRPYKLKDKDISVFGRNALVSYQVWSAEFGYPGDENYREFHKHSPRSGLKYWKVTNRNKPFDQKEVYNVHKAEKKAKEHAAHFVDVLQNTISEAQKIGFNRPLIVGCYDTELFGHWWWEGVIWLEEVMRQIDEKELNMALPSNVEPPRHEAEIFDSSWGMGGKHFVWYNRETMWMWEIIEKARQEYDVIAEGPGQTELEYRVKQQALKELMLIQSSDWLFMVTNNLTRDYAMKRFFEHYTKFLRLVDSLKNNRLDADFIEWFKQIEFEDDLFNSL
ncbi:glycoside hydrolase family 57 protein [Thermosyntropha sp.]|uniref:glycoside hydrolase family 57 protein n=1 Tax=Thermosyntropha sp. TaxID=2740820 RepID=UPI0025D5D9C2|nr:glycoside hydrolase family 57 protein [Thermosyntropha sp.]MBO8158345.1 glycoside hydrolase family 57 protein [Thermosyntropha sp.]